MRKFVIIFFIVFIALGQAFAVEIKGRVVSSEGLPVADAVVLVKSEKAQAVTNADGVFVLNVDTLNKVTLQVIHVAYLEKEFTLSAKDLSAPVVLTVTPYIRQKEEVVVTALRYPEPLNKIPAAETVVVSETLEARMASNITQALAGLPGVVPLGTGGFSLVPTIRGLARNRILIMIDNARITSDRRTGPNASFVNPEDIERIEILRSPSSVFYGSDAIGGVVHIFTKRARAEGIHGQIHAGYSTNNENGVYGLSLSGKKGEFAFYLSGQNSKAGNYESPVGEVLRSGFNQASLFGRVSYENKARRIDLSFLGARGTDIGKPAIDSETKPTWYPRENQNLARLHWTEKNVGGGEINVLAYVNPNFLETRTNTISGYIAGGRPGYVSKEARSRTESTEYGVQLSYGRKLSKVLRLTGGLDIFGRADAGAENSEVSFNASGNITKTFSETPFSDGFRSDVGFYLSADYTGFKNLDIVGGIRTDVLSQKANPGGGRETLESKRNAVTGFFALSYRITDSLTAFANVSRAYRTPGLSELFYSGITGRGFIIAQPGLTPEMSISGDAGLRFISSRFFGGIYAFRYGIDGLIDRFLVAERTYTYGNLEDVRIQGIELELEYYPIQGWKIFGNLFALKGESRATGLTVNDIPPFRLFLGSQIWYRKLSFEANLTFQAKKDNPGPAEIVIPAYEYAQLRASYNYGPVSVFCLVQNALNRTFLGRPDPSAVNEPARNIVFGVRYVF